MISKPASKNLRNLVPSKVLLWSTEKLDEMAVVVFDGVGLMFHL